MEVGVFWNNAVHDEQASAVTARESATTVLKPADYVEEIRGVRPLLQVIEWFPFRANLNLGFFPFRDHLRFVCHQFSLLGKRLNSHELATRSLSEESLAHCSRKRVERDLLFDFHYVSQRIHQDVFAVAADLKFRLVIRLSVLFFLGESPNGCSLALSCDRCLNWGRKFRTLDLFF